MGVLAQKKEKPRLLIYGSNEYSSTAAFQAAQSNVPTVLVYDKPIDTRFSLSELAKNSKEDLKPESHLKDPDSLGALEFGALVVNEFNNKINPFLTEIDNKTVKKLVKTKKGWEVTLSDNQKFNVISIIDATENSDLTSLSKLNFDVQEKDDFTLPKDMSLAMSRTTVASIAHDSIRRVIFLEDLLKAQKDNLFNLGIGRKYLALKPAENSLEDDLSAEEEENDDIGDLPFAKALGATAGYLAFFKSDAGKIDIRKLQSELITFDSNIIPYQDVSSDDNHFKAIVKCYLTGFFLGKEHEGKYIFDKAANVKFDEIKPVFNDIYTRSQLWFLDNYRNDDLTWKDLISLIRFVSFKGEEVETQIAKGWSTKLKFEGEYNPENKITREQFAVVTDLYSSAFAKAINLDGSFVK